MRVEQAFFHCAESVLTLVAVEARDLVLGALRELSERAWPGLEFLEALDAAVVGVAEMPRMGSPVSGVADQGIRRRAVRRFPYHVIYLGLPDRLLILAVAHDRRRPGY
jgi:hypothetical protein